MIAAMTWKMVPFIVVLAFVLIGIEVRVLTSTVASRVAQTNLDEIPMMCIGHCERD